MIKPTPINQYIFCLLRGSGDCVKFPGVWTTVGEKMGEDTVVFCEAPSIGVVVGAAAVAVSSEAFGVNVAVAVGAPKFVGVGE